MRRLAVRARGWPGWQLVCSTPAGQVGVGLLGGTVLGLGLRLLLFALGALLIRVVAILAARGVALVA